jgi:hypothetical protein
MTDSPDPFCRAGVPRPQSRTPWGVASLSDDDGVDATDGIGWAASLNSERRPWRTR